MAFPRALSMVPAALLALSLAACGPQHALPLPSQQEVAAASATIASAEPLRRYNRSREEQMAMLARVARRVAQGGEPLCREYRGGPCDFRLALDTSNEVNAYASGANQVAVTSGMMNIVENEDELAAVVAHEFAHHLANHIARATQRTQLGGVAGSLLGAYLGSQFGVDLTEQAGQIGAGIGRLSYSVAEEREADYLAAYMVQRAGYDLDRAGQIWVRLTRASGTGRETTGILDTHPAGPERLAAWERTVQEIRSQRDPMPRRRVD